MIRSRLYLKLCDVSVAGDGNDDDDTDDDAIPVLPVGIPVVEIGRPDLIDELDGGGGGGGVDEDSGTGECPVDWTTVRATWRPAET